jgi:glycosyltransferase involved in cell wall biosynthesis
LFDMSYTQFEQHTRAPRNDDPFISVIIPAYNEIERIVPTIASIAGYLSTRDLSFEIIVSDDGSTDGTPDRCRRLPLANLSVLDPGVNRGKGAAVRSGVQAARGELVLFSDADLSTPIEEITPMLDAMFDADVVIGSRAAGGADEGDKPLLRRLLSRGSRFITRRALGIDIHDTQCGFKLFRREATDRLFSVQRIDGFSFDAEVLFLANRLGMRVTELPVRWIDAPGSKVKALQATWGFLKDLALVRLGALLGRYPETVRPSTGLQLALVTAVPPSEATLNEYGLHLANRLADVPEVAEVTILAEDTNGIPTGNGATAVRAAWTFDSIMSMPRIVWSALRLRPDAVMFNLHFTSFGGRKPAAALGLMTPAVLRLFGIPTVVLLHNLVDTTDLDAAGYATNPVLKRILESIGRLLTRVVLCANHVCTTMPDYVDILRDRYGATNVSLTPHGSFEVVDLPDQWAGAQRILAFGKFGTYKRVDELIEAFRILQASDEHAQLELVIAGTDSPVTPGYLDNLRSECADLRNVRFTGYVPEEDVADLFIEATVVVFPYTATTGSSGPLHQAGSYGRAVVAPRLGDFVGLIEEEGFAAASFEPGVPESLAATLSDLLGDPAALDAMGRQNHAAATGLPLADIAHWHVAHLRSAIER